MSIFKNLHILPYNESLLELRRWVGSNPLPPTRKPPIGLRPKHLVYQERMKEILEAMIRYVEAGKKIPVEWFGELDDLNEELK